MVRHALTEKQGRVIMLALSHEAEKSRLSQHDTQASRIMVKEVLPVPKEREETGQTRHGA
jgi:hypothetical protein